MSFPARWGLKQECERRIEKENKKAANKEQWMNYTEGVKRLETDAHVQDKWACEANIDDNRQSPTVGIRRGAQDNYKRHMGGSLGSSLGTFMTGDQLRGMDVIPQYSNSELASSTSGVTEELKKEKDELLKQIASVSQEKERNESRRRQELLDEVTKLRDIREAQREQEADVKKYQAWADSCEELRHAKSKLMQQDAVNTWNHQIQEKQEKQLQDQQLEKMSHDQILYDMEKKQMYDKMQREIEQEKQKSLVNSWDAQVAEMRKADEELKEMQKKDQALKQELYEINEFETIRKKSAEQIKKKEHGRILMNQYTAKLRQRAREIQKNMEEDRLALDHLLKIESDATEEERLRKETEREHVKQMRDLLEAKIKTEKQRELELECLAKDEIKRYWDKRETEWESEERRRKNLFFQVTDELKNSTYEKLRDNECLIKDKENEKNELLNRLKRVEMEKQRQLDQIVRAQHDRRYELEMQKQELDKRKKEAEAQFQSELEEARKIDRRNEEMIRRETSKLPLGGSIADSYTGGLPCVPPSRESRILSSQSSCCDQRVSSSRPPSRQSYMNNSETGANNESNSNLYDNALREKHKPQNTGKGLNFYNGFNENSRPNTPTNQQVFPSKENLSYNNLDTHFPSHNSPSQNMSERSFMSNKEESIGNALNPLCNPNSNVTHCQDNRPASVRRTQSEEFNFYNGYENMPDKPKSPLSTQAKIMPGSERGHSELNFYNGFKDQSPEPSLYGAPSRQSEYRNSQAHSTSNICPEASNFSSNEHYPSTKNFNVPAGGDGTYNQEPNSVERFQKQMDEYCSGSKENENDNSFSQLSNRPRSNRSSVARSFSFVG